MKKRSLLWMMFGLMAISLIGAAGIYAAETMPEEITLSSPEQTKGPVTFTHQKHSKDYNIGCGECHHNDKGQPLTNLKPGEPVKKCIDCHTKPGLVKGKEAREMPEKEQLAHIGNAFHTNCIDCHKKVNKEKNTKAAPQACKDCHPKE